ncbi:MAG TPA: zinc-binding dehydrogenase [Candidatus Acidoferrales bacterium]|nr:zinc-binding dehydrogenase [Candidatus Acidoferrales bacterium]
MSAIRLHEVGGPKHLRLDAIELPIPLDGEVLVRVRAAAFNRRDVFITQGLYPGISLPRTLGSDGAGVLDGSEVVIDPTLAWGNDPHVWQASASILGMPHDGTFAQWVAVPASNVHPKPAHLSMEEAAALPLAGLTAFRATFTRGELKAGETVLIPGVGGGVQTFVLQYAKAAGARVIVTSGSNQKLERARALGADVAINYAEQPDWHKALKRGEVDLVVDSSGGDTLNKAIGIVRPGGRLVIYGGTRGEATIRLFPVFWNHLDIRGTSMGSPEDFRAMLEFVSAHRITPAVDRVYAMSDAVAAAERMAQGEQFGKIVMTVE